jgi:cation diffusion facilitator CzcD-associated flavoprotein CzcO
MINRPYDTDVLVVGAGPVGLTLALDLTRRGVRVRLVDRAPGTFPGSRAKGIQPRTLEVFDDLGVADEAFAAGGDYPPLGAHLGPLTIPWRMHRHQTPTPQTPYPNVLLLPPSCAVPSTAPASPSSSTLRSAKSPRTISVRRRYWKAVEASARGTSSVRTARPVSSESRSTCLSRAAPTSPTK